MHDAHQSHLLTRSLQLRVQGHVLHPEKILLAQAGRSFGVYVAEAYSERRLASALVATLASPLRLATAK